jgi:hypothetical protein
MSVSLRREGPDISDALDSVSVKIFDPSEVNILEGFWVNVWLR